MGLFKMGKKTEKNPVTEYSEIEQGTPQEEPSAPVQVSNTELLERLDRVLANQATIVENQQIILNANTATQELIKVLAGADEPVETEAEEEEVAPKKTVLKGKKGK